MKKAYILMADGDGTLRSVDKPIGVAVTDEEEAKRYEEEGGVGYTHSYKEVLIYEDKDEALHERYHQDWQEEDCEYCQKGKKVRIYGAANAADFEMEVHEDELTETARRIYADHPGEHGYYTFTKYLWVEFPDDREDERLDYIVPYKSGGLGEKPD